MMFESSILAAWFRIFVDGMVGAHVKRKIDPMHSSVECRRPRDWSYPVLYCLRERPTPTVFVTDAVVEHQPPPPSSTVLFINSSTTAWKILLQYKLLTSDLISNS